MKPTVMTTGISIIVKTMAYIKVELIIREPKLQSQ
jgi:hypothetical protein